MKKNKEYATVKCIGCGAKKHIDLKQERDYAPHCDKCFMPMTVVRVTVTNKQPNK